MKFGSTVTSIWRVMARYMRNDSFKILEHLSQRLGRNQSPDRHGGVDIAPIPIVVST
jgi:hypothetical protein